MPRKTRQPSPTGVYHFINRGINKKQIFHIPEDFEHYKSLLKEYSKLLNIRIFHYCLMPNHTHMLVEAPAVEDLSRFGHFVGRRYAYYYCKTYGWSEQLFRKRFKSLAIKDDRYLLECGRYIERNPLDAQLAGGLKEYPYSSIHYYGYNETDDLITPSPAFLGLSDDETQRRAMYLFYVTQARLKEIEEPVPF